MFFFKFRKALRNPRVPRNPISEALLYSNKKFTSKLIILFTPWNKFCWILLTTNCSHLITQTTFEVKYVQRSSSHETVFIIVYSAINIFMFVYSFFELATWRQRQGLKRINCRVWKVQFCFLNLNLAVLFEIDYSV